MEKKDKKENDYDIKLEYNKLKEKFTIPPYKELAEDFDIEKVNEKESDFLLREIRRAVGEKISSYMHFFELLINPSSPPLFLFSVIKTINKETKDKINSMYKGLAKFQIEAMKLDTIYDEKDEAKYINDIFDEWQKLKREIYKIMETFECNIEEIEEVRKGGYFG